MCNINAKVSIYKFDTQTVLGYMQNRYCFKEKLQKTAGDNRKLSILTETYAVKALCS